MWRRTREGTGLGRPGCLGDAVVGENVSPTQLRNGSRGGVLFVANELLSLHLALADDDGGGQGQEEYAGMQAGGVIVRLG